MPRRNDEFRTLVTACTRLELRAVDGELELHVTVRSGDDAISMAEKLASQVHDVVGEYTRELADHTSASLTDDPYRPLPAPVINGALARVDRAEVDAYERRPASRYNNLVARTGKVLTENASAHAMIAAGIDTTDAGLERYRRERRRGPAFIVGGGKMRVRSVHTTPASIEPVLRERGHWPDDDPRGPPPPDRLPAQLSLL